MRTRDRFVPLHTVVLRCLLLPFIFLLCVGCNADNLPPVQHHVYYSGSHVTSITLGSESSDLFATDVVQGRVIHYNSSTGRVVDVWQVTDPALYSPTSAAYMYTEYDAVRSLLYVADSTTGQVVKVNAQTGKRDITAALSIPGEMWECGLVLAERLWDETDVYVIDRYRGYTAAFSTNRPNNRSWISLPAPAPPASNLTTTYLAAATFMGGSSGVLLVLDYVSDRVLRLSAENGTYMEPLVFALPDAVKGIQALSWTWCTGIDAQDSGCLWVMYQPDRSSGTERTVVAVSVSNNTVVHNWTIAAARESREGVEGGAGVTASNNSDNAQLRAMSNAHLASPAMLVRGQGIDSDPFRVYTAEVNPDGPGHVIVVRNESGVLLQWYDPIPLLHDASIQLMHAFRAVQTDKTTCTLWLTDVQNGGLLVQATADGSLLQSFKTPVLFTSVVLDLSASTPSLVLLFTNTTDWQLWRFFPYTRLFTQLNTTAVHCHYGGGPGRKRDLGDMTENDYVSVAVGGLAVDQTGRLLLSLTYADAVVLLGADGQLDPTFNVSGEVVRPGIVAFADIDNVVVVDRSGLDGQWYLKSFYSSGGYPMRIVPIVPPMSLPLAVIYDEQVGVLWISDANGLIFQVEPVTLEVVPGGILQPMPPAYDVESLSMDSIGTLYGTSTMTRRLIMLFVVADRQFKPASKPCGIYSMPSSSSSSTTSLSSSSLSSTGSSPSAPDAHGGLLDNIEPLVVGAVCATLAVVLIASVSRCYWVMRQRSSGLAEDTEGDDAKSDQDLQVVYERWNDVLESDLSTDHKQADAMANYVCSVNLSRNTLPGTGRRSTSRGSGRALNIVDTADSRYDAYVRLYEELSDAQGDTRRRGDGVAAKGYSDDSVTHLRGTSSTSVESSSASTLYASSLSKSTNFILQSSGDSGSGSVNTLPLRVSAPSAIACISSPVVPRFIDEVIDLHMLGEGMSGRVYCGYYQGLPVVVKLPKSQEMSAAQWREWQAHLRLPSHPNLVSFVGSLVMAHTNYLVLRWVEQGSLKSLLNDATAAITALWYSRPYGVMRAALDVAAALHHVHLHGLVHRDVSARNVLVDADGTFVLADLGMCQEADSSTSTATTTTTPAASTPHTIALRWCSPDSLSTQRYTGKSDVWALGVTMWEMASGGRVPYSDVNDQRWLQQQLKVGLLSLQVDAAWITTYESTDERGLAGRVKALIDCCLTSDVRQRPDSGQLLGKVHAEMEDWEAQHSEEAERVRVQWEHDHAAARAARAVIAAPPASATAVSLP